MHNDFTRAEKDAAARFNASQNTNDHDAFPPFEHSEQIDENAFELEISELPPGTRSHFLLLKLTNLRARLTQWLSTHVHRRPRKAKPLSRAQRRHTIGRVLTAFAICLILLVLLLGNAPGLRSHLANLLLPTPTPTPVWVASLNSSMPVITMHPGDQSPRYPQSSPGILPASCPQISTLQYFMTPLDPPGLGASPIWFSGFNGPSAALNNLVPIDAPVAHAPWPAGWYSTLAVFIQKGYSGNITLQGSSQSDGSPIWLSRDTPQILGNSLTLNLNDGSHYVSNGQWEMTSITIAVPKAGCYEFQARNGGTLWTRYFAAGQG